MELKFTDIKQGKVKVEGQDNIISEHDKVTNYLAKYFEPVYTVLSNVESPKHYISSIFPDLILQDKTDKKIQFIIEVRKNGGIAQCMQAWKSIPSVPSTLYIVVPKDTLSESKKVAEIIGLSARFGWYEISKDDEIKVEFE